MTTIKPAPATPPLASPTATPAGIRSVRDLQSAGLIEPENSYALERVAERFSISITPAMLDLMTPAAPGDPIARQFVPDPRELEIMPGDVSDPIGDAAHAPIPGIIHRYPDRLLLTPIKVCPVYCRFCFRRETVGKSDGLLSNAELDAAIDYIRAHEEIWEVILSGGDPLQMSPRRLASILAQLDSIEHVRVVRIHTRVPVVSPERITTELVAKLRISKAVFVVLHSNHASEITAEAKDAIAMLIDNGIPMLCQSVLLKGINDNAATLEALLRTLVENRIKPYYLHHADRAPGTTHFRTTLAAGQELMRELRGRISGLCQPEYVLDIPGGAGKAPAGPIWVEPAGDSTYLVDDYQGNTHTYSDGGV